MISIGLLFKIIRGGPVLIDKKTCYTVMYSHQENGKPVIISVHRLIMGLQYGDIRQVDHINHNGLNNRRNNLRICTFQENHRNSQHASNNTTGFKGVHRYDDEF